MKIKLVRKGKVSERQILDDMGSGNSKVKLMVCRSKRMETLENVE
jgi:hypothetical protein